VTPINYVVSQNLHRWQLNESQRAMVGDKIANMKFGENQHTRKQGGPIGLPSNGTTTVSQRQAGKMMNVSERSRRARIVRTRGVRGFCLLQILADFARSILGRRSPQMWG
jgi:hypothetical protein